MLLFLCWGADYAQELLQNSFRAWGLPQGYLGDHEVLGNEPRPSACKSWPPVPWAIIFQAWLGINGLLDSLDPMFSYGHYFDPSPQCHPPRPFWSGSVANYMDHLVTSLKKTDDPGFLLPEDAGFLWIEGIRRGAYVKDDPRNSALKVWLISPYPPWGKD